jgi:hypothetical protein
LLAGGFELCGITVARRFCFVESGLRDKIPLRQRLLLTELRLRQLQRRLGSTHLRLEGSDLGWPAGIAEVRQFFTGRTGARFGFGQGLRIRVGSDRKDRLPGLDAAAAGAVE